MDTILLTYQIQYEMKQIVNTLYFLFILSVILSCQNEKVETKGNKTSELYKKMGMEASDSKVYESLRLGDIAPDFTGKDQFGNEHSLSSLTQDSSLVIIFYRGQWCPICNRYLSKFAKDLNIINDLGARVIAITPELSENVQITVDNTGLNIPIISDLDRSIMDAYKVSFKVTEKYNQKIKDKLGTDIAKNNGSEEAWLPIPATYVIGVDKKIKYVHFDPNYKTRASVQNIIKHL